MQFLTLSAVAALAGSAAAKSCQNITIPIDVTSRNAIFGNVKVPQTNLEAVQFALNSTRQGANGTELALTGYHTIQKAYNISAKVCVPQNQSVKAVQLLSHGIGFDKTYWDLAYNNYNYSYVDTALSQGYATVAIDRLGIGNSTHGEPRDEIQSFLEVEGLAAVTRKLRNGSVPGVNTTYTRVIHVGHSFGSAQTYAMINKYPDLSDGAVLTGFSMNASFVSLFTAGNDFQQANLNQPLRFGSKQNAAALMQLINTYSLTDLASPIDPTTVTALDYPNGYLTNSNNNANIYLFLNPGNFDEGISYYGEMGKQPVTVGEALTLGSVPMMNQFTKPVLVMTGAYDLPYCGGNCTATGNPQMSSIPAAAAMNFPNNKMFEAYIQPNTGHGLNFHYNATAGYRYVQTWLGSHGLAAR